MTAGVKVDQKTGLRIAKLYASGLNTHVLAERFQLSVTTIADIIRRNGGTLREPASKRTKQCG